MQNDLPNKKLSMLGISSETNELELLISENERLKKLLEEKEKELEIVKKHFEDVINSITAINPNPINIVPFQITYPTYPTQQYPNFYTSGSSAAVDFNLSSQSQLSFFCSSKNTLYSGDYSDMLNHNDSTFLMNNSYQIFQINSDENENDIISLTG